MINGRHLHTLLLSIALASLSPAVMADTAACGFDRALEQLVNGNPSVRTTALRAESETESLKAENTLGGPEAEFSRVWGNNAEVGNKWGFSVSQGFDWPGVYAARREAIRTASVAAQYLKESTLLDVRQQAGQLLLDLIHLNQLIEMQTTLTERADEMVEIYRKGAEDGTQTRLDYNKSVLERIAVHRELHTLQAQYDTLLEQMADFAACEDIHSIIDGVGNEYPEAPQILPMPTVETLKQRDPAYAAAKARVEAAKSMAKVERRMSLPGFSVGYVHETEAGGSFNGFSIGISLPSYGRKHQTRAARLEAEASELEAEMALLSAGTAMRTEAHRAGVLRHVIEEYEPVVKDNSNIELLTKAFRAGQITYLTYIQECNYFMDAYRNYIDSLYEYHSAIWRLRRYE